MSDLLEKIKAFFSTWLQETILSKDSAYQLVLFLGIFIIAFFVARFLKKIILPITKRVNFKHREETISWFNCLIFPILLYIGLGISRNLVAFLAWKSPVMNGLTTFSGTFILVRIAKRLVVDRFWRRTIALFLWTVAFLNVFKLLEATVHLLDSVQFNFGETHISIFTIIKGVFLLSFILWAVNYFSQKIEEQIHKSTHINPSVKGILSKSIRILFYVFGVLIGLRTIGLKLTSFTFLSGAVGLGIGFGLQKIVANLFSGLILLMEHSVKPGDVIEMDSMFGIIKTLNPRHITLKTIEGKEMLIPNEDLITQKVINWSYSDRFIRLSVLVGVSYNENIPTVMDLVGTATKRVNRISQKRKPAVLLKEFNSSSIDIETAFWITDPENGIENVKSQLRLEIWKIFQENHVEIPFPQQDIHIKSDSILKTMQTYKEGNYGLQRYDS